MFKKPYQGKAAAQNKSFADVFDSMLTDGKKFISFLSMLFCIAALVFISFMAMNKYSGSAVKEMEFSATGARVLFEAESPSGKAQYLLTVHPQGWQNTGIRVDEKSVLSFKADGRINFDGGGVFRTVSYRKNLEDKIKAKLELDDKSADEKQTPEYHFSDEEKKKVMLLRPWVDPDGFAPNTTDERIVSFTYGNRAERLELKEENLGCLIGKIVDLNKNSQAFKIGKNKEIKPPMSGELWLNVNDIKNLQTDLPQQMFYQDNLGFFWVVLTINPS